MTSTQQTRRRRHPLPYPTADALSPIGKSGPLEPGLPSPTTVVFVASPGRPSAPSTTPAEAPPTGLPGLLRYAWRMGWNVRAALLAAGAAFVLVLLFLVIVPVVTSAVYALGNIAALLVGVFAGGWVVSKVMGPVAIDAALHQLVTMVVIAVVLLMALTARCTWWASTRWARRGTSR
jgi:hypothetical protein